MDDLISRQDAIKAIDEKAKRIKNEDTLNGLAGAVGILFDLPPVNPQESKYCDRNICMANEYNGIGCDECEVTKSQTDAVSRQAVLSMQYRIDDSATLSTRDVVNVDDIEDLPSVNTQEKVGYWIPIEYPTGVEAFGVKEMSAQELQCSECGKTVDISDGDFKYCPYCKARMVEPQESDHTCHTCKHYTSGERDGSCGSYICKGYSDWESEEV